MPGFVPVCAPNGGRSADAMVVDCSCIRAMLFERLHFRPIFVVLLIYRIIVRGRVERSVMIRTRGIAGYSNGTIIVYFINLLNYVLEVLCF